MRPERRAILALLARALAWLPACLAAWYLASPVLSWIPARIAAPVLGALAGKVTGTALDHGIAAYEISIAPPYRPGDLGGPDAQVTIEVNPRVYTYGLALFLALSLAMPRPWRVRRLVAGCAVLAVLPAWGLAFDALKQLGTTAQLAPFLRWTPAGREAVAFGYQVGALLLPSLAPVAMWLGLNPEVAGPHPLRTLDSSSA